MLNRDQLQSAIPHALEGVDLPGLGERIRGKVRDMYLAGDRRVIVTSDRVSAFDRVLGTVPFKGQVLNQLSAWWFSQIEDIVGHHVAAMPDPNVMITREAKTLPVEVIVRGYITGSTSTSLWTLYNDGVDKPYGLDLPEGLRKNDKLPENVITPTTKAEQGQHDERLTCAEVESNGLVEPDLWKQVQEVALEIFRRGQEVADKAGLILVDTKYEFGMIDGKLCVIDEIHTPDSSRYWVKDTYQAAIDAGKNPEHFDKEYLRLKLVEQGFKGDGEAPELSDEIKIGMASQYISAYERLTGEDFVPAIGDREAHIKALAESGKLLG